MMAAARPTQRSTRHTWWRYVLTLSCMLAALTLALRVVHPAELWGVVVQSNRWWLLVALGCKLFTPLALAAVLQAALRLPGYRVALPTLWLTAQVALLVSMAAPVGAVAMGAFLFYVFRRRGISNGATTLAITLHGLTYGITLGIVAALGMGYLLSHGELQVRQIREVTLLTLLIVLGALALWGVQRDRADLTRRVVAVQGWLARRLRRPWREAALRAYLDELYRGKGHLAAHPAVFWRLIALQAGALALDVLTLYSIVRALGVVPHPAVVVLGYVLAMFLAGLTPLPGGGGVCEATLVLALTRLGVTLEVSLGAMLLYRALTFWLPLLLSILIAPQFFKLPAAEAGDTWS